MKYINIAIFLFLLTISCFSNSSSNTDNIISDDVDPYYNLISGFSPFSGIIGFEYQTSNNAYGIGLPGHLSYRYYYKPYKDTIFWGVFLGSFTLNATDNEKYTHKGEDYSKLEWSYLGTGIGYRWQWASGWNVNTSISLEYFDHKYSGSTTLQSDTHKGFTALPGFTVGYKF
jgi:hypothetical protein